MLHTKFHVLTCFLESFSRCCRGSQLAECLASTTLASSQCTVPCTSHHVHPPCARSPSPHVHTRQPSHPPALVCMSANLKRTPAKSHVHARPAACARQPAPTLARPPTLVCTLPSPHGHVCQRLHAYPPTSRAHPSSTMCMLSSPMCTSSNLICQPSACWPPP